MPGFRNKLLQIKAAAQNILILGCGVSGFAAAYFCVRAGISCEIWDQADELDARSNQSASDNIDKLISLGVRFKFAKDSKICNPNFALLIVSPGIPPWSKLLQIEQIGSLEKVSELELGLEIIREASDCRHVVVTGSNGKSTTVSLLQHILTANGYESALVGNIGKSALDLISSDLILFQSLDFLVVEASSYQLESFKFFRPDVGVMLNLAENHLERHKTMAEYLEAKRKLVSRSVSSDFLVIADSGEWRSRFEAGFKGRILRFGTDYDADAKIDYENLTCLLRDSSVYQARQGRLLGEHNLKNIAAAALASQAVGLKGQDIFKACATFESLEHRLELIELPNQKLICNDSKATTVEASLAACRAILSANFNRKVFLLLGGEQKQGSNWKPLAEFIKSSKERFEALELFGADAELIAAQIKEVGLSVHVYKSLTECLKQVNKKLNAYNILLLSPGCASFDEFSNFEHRGQFFKQFFKHDL